MTQEKQTVIAFVEKYIAWDEVNLGGHVLRWSGRFVEQEQKLQGRDLSQWLIHNMPPASNVIMVWEGVCENDWCADHGADWEPRFRGQWRKPTADELQSLTEDQLQ